MDLDPAALRMMRAIADTGTISGAAEVIGSSQPAISQHVRRLERRLGTSLLERAGRGVRLTQAGEVLAKHGLAVTEALRAACDEIESLAGLQTGRVRVTAFPSATASILPSALASLRDEHSGVRVELTEAEPPELTQRVRDGLADLAVTFRYPEATDTSELRGLVSVDLLDDPMWLALPEGHPAVPSGQRAVNLETLADETWIAGCPRCRGHLLAVCAQAGFEPEVTYATDDYTAVLALVEAGLGVALAPALVLESGRTRKVSLHRVSPASSRIVHLVTTEDLAKVPAVNLVVSLLTRTAAETAVGSTLGVATS